MRCAELADRLHEPMLGTAGSSTAWLALEEPGPWGARAPGDSRLGWAFAAELAARAQRAGLRLQLIRGNDGGGEGSRRRCLLAHHGGSDRPFLEVVELEQAEQVLELDLDAVGRGEPTGAGVLAEDRHFLTCTNGKRDPCCATRGRPVARALEALAPGRAWQTTHLGAHRFAANVLVLPDGLVFGRVRPDLARALVAEIDGGCLPLELLRGRSGRSARAQAAEAFLRASRGITGLYELALLHDGDDVAVFAHGGRRYAVSVGSRQLEPRTVSCAADKLERPQEFSLLEIVSQPVGEVQHV